MCENAFMCTQEAVAKNGAADLVACLGTVVDVQARTGVVFNMLETVVKRKACICSCCNDEV